MKRRCHAQEQELAIFQQNRLQLSTQLSNRSGPELAAATGCAAPLHGQQMVMPSKPSHAQQRRLCFQTHGHPGSTSRNMSTLHSVQTARSQLQMRAEGCARQTASWHPTAGESGQSMVGVCAAHRGGSNGSAATLFYSIRANAGVSGPLQGRGLADGPPTVAAGDEALLGQLEWVEAGVVSGWACVRGAPNQVLKVHTGDAVPVSCLSNRLLCSSCSTTSPALANPHEQSLRPECCFAPYEAACWQAWHRWSETERQPEHRILMHCGSPCGLDWQPRSSAPADAGVRGWRAGQRDGDRRAHPAPAHQPPVRGADQRERRRRQPRAGLPHGAAALAARPP